MTGRCVVHGDVEFRDLRHFDSWCADHEHCLDNRPKHPRKKRRP